MAIVRDAAFLASAWQVLAIFCLKDNMTELTESDMIWNRACGEDPLRTLPGDRALADLLYAHGLAMNGGVLHAVECLTAEELSDAQAGYRFYGFDDVASLLSRARSVFEAADDLGSHEQRLDGEYIHFVPSDRFLDEHFQIRLKANPSDFAPLRVKDLG